MVSSRNDMHAELLPGIGVNVSSATGLYVINVDRELVQLIVVLV
jgi:hypothetical protein